MTLAAALSRRVFLTMTGLALGKAAFAQSSPTQETPVPSAEPAMPASVATPEPTPEGKALAEAAIASAGHPLAKDDQVEVEKQLSSYPASNGGMRGFHTENGVAPSTGFTPASPQRKP